MILLNQNQKHTITLTGFSFAGTLKEALTKVRKKYSVISISTNLAKVSVTP